jgi:chemotaxis signal transduction protein
VYQFWISTLAAIMELNPTIIAVAGARHYLVGVIDINGNFSPLPQLGDIAVCKSLSAAKQLLRKNKIHTAEIILQSAYDEMCGLSSPALAKQTLYL